ncbi:MAG: TolC family protein [Candidatus Obscuribacter sp.]|nr:TolC family protein [Candidatus Obscuribacter sp.]
MQELIKEDRKAKIMLSRAEEIADETPTLLIAARENEIKAKERYRVGLTNVIEVAEAERILARAQAQDIEAQLKVWQALLAISYAHGDIQPFLKLVAAAENDNAAPKNEVTN